MTAPTAPPLEQVSQETLLQSTAVIEAQGQQVAQQTLAAEAAVAALILAMMSGDDGEAWYSFDATREMSRRLAGLADNLAVGVSRQADVWTARAISLVTGRRVRPLGVRGTVGWVGERGVRGGDTPSAAVFGRAADTYRYQQSLRDQRFMQDVAEELSSPTELVSPLDAAINRAQKAAQMNLQLAARKQSSAVLMMAERQGLITGYRRVLHNELSEEGSCGLCIAASTRVYQAGDLMPMHPGCHCQPVPVTKNRDPGAAINEMDLGRFYADAGGTDVAKLRATRYKVDQHGEYGPVLRPHGDPIRTADEALRDTNRLPRQRHRGERTRDEVRAELSALEERLPTLSTAQQREWMTNRIATLREELRGQGRPKTDADRARTLRARRSKLERAHRQLTTSGVVPPQWQDRLAEVERRISTLDRQVTRLGG